MKHAALPLLTLTLLLAACQAPEAPKPSTSISGWAIGTDYDGNPITVGKNELEGKPLVLTYFATW